MSARRTFFMVKPDVMDRSGEILARVVAEGFTVLRSARRRLTEAEARSFYAVHREAPFFDSLVGFIVSGEVFGAELAADDAVARLRRLVGATDPADAAPGTLRALYGSSVEHNAVHASDGEASYEHETAVFFGSGGMDR